MQSKPLRGPEPCAAQKAPPMAGRSWPSSRGNHAAALEDKGEPYKSFATASTEPPSGTARWASITAPSVNPRARYTSDARTNHTLSFGKLAFPDSRPGIDDEQQPCTQLGGGCPEKQRPARRTEAVPGLGDGPKDEPKVEQEEGCPA